MIRTASSGRQVPVDFAASGVAAMSVNGHKLAARSARCTAAGPDHRLYALLPAGTGARRTLGTLDVAGIVAFAVAISRASAATGICATVSSLRDELVARIRVAFGCVFNGDPTIACGQRAFSFPLSGDALLLLLDAAGIAARTGSRARPASRSVALLLAMGADDDRAGSSLRFTLGRTSTGHIDELLACCPVG